MAHYLGCTLTWHCKPEGSEVLFVAHCDTVWKGQHLTQLFNGECNLQWTSPTNKSHVANSAMR